MQGMSLQKNATKCFNQVMIFQGKIYSEHLATKRMRI